MIYDFHAADLIENKNQISQIVYIKPQIFLRAIGIARIRPCTISSTFSEFLKFCHFYSRDVRQMK